MVVWYSSSKKTKLLTPDEEVDLAKKVRKGDKKARHKFIESNLRLVALFAGRSVYKDRGLPLVDLLSLGSMGLIRGVDKYDPYKINPRSGRPYKFSTYATWWIMQQITRGLEYEADAIRAPYHIHELVGKWQKKYAQLRDKYGKKPTEMEVGRALGMDNQQIEEIKEIVYHFLKTRDVLSLDSFGRERFDELEPASPREEQARLEHLHKIERLTKCMEKLGDREKQVVEKRYLIPEPMTLLQVGNELNLTRERIRQIEVRDLKKLKKFYRGFERWEKEKRLEDPEPVEYEAMPEPGKYPEPEKPEPAEFPEQAFPESRYIVEVGLGKKTRYEFFDEEEDVDDYLSLVKSKYNGEITNIRVVRRSRGEVVLSSAL